MRGGELGVFAAQLGDVRRPALRRHQRLRHADRAAGVVYIDRLAAFVVRVDLHRRVHAASGGAADQQRQFETLPLHFGRHVAHLVERRRDQPGQTDDVGLLGARGLQNLRRRHHDAEIDDLVIVAREHDADDVLADVVHVALDRRHYDLAVGRALGRAARAPALLFFLLHVRHQVSDRLLHHARRLHHLRQEHLSGAEQVADDVHAVH